MYVAVFCWIPLHYSVTSCSDSSASCCEHCVSAAAVFPYSRPHRRSNDCWCFLDSWDGQFGQMDSWLSSQLDRFRSDDFFRDQFVHFPVGGFVFTLHYCKATTNWAVGSLVAARRRKTSWMQKQWSWSNQERTKWRTGAVETLSNSEDSNTWRYKTIRSTLRNHLLVPVAGQNVSRLFVLFLFYVISARLVCSTSECDSCVQTHRAKRGETPLLVSDPPVRWIQVWKLFLSLWFCLTVRGVLVGKSTPWLTEYKSTRADGEPHWFWCSASSLAV